jgi:hypothetical protein
LCILQGIDADTFYNVFDGVLGKSLMFIVRKDRHEPDYITTTYEIIRITDKATILEYFSDRGFSIVPSKVGWISIYIFIYYFHCSLIYSIDELVFLSGFQEESEQF